ncbi:hypothetical protein GpartN1_g7806.t1 [Galdieria partita]|uniref:Beta-catenin-like protein 1 N-terminal domain-containing protein n=1 Tax=Galdieria partita TaxID=83374 RepID=A0A9C7UVD3_9RHOD|nr:hypothetical protein GpartN1_g7794.t1 [Galdieria partita]GJQ16015.1 hypothetical protein GpartN1_g7806.t1 [Galdieria partita]
MTSETISVKKLSLQLEQAIKENTQQRSKYPDEPLRFEESEVALDQAIQDFRSIASFPELFEQIQIWSSIIGLLGHENTDIVVDVIHLLNDFCEEDETENLQWIDHWVQCGLLSGLISAMERLDLSQWDEASGFYSGLSILENILELNPRLSTQLAKDTQLFSLLTRYLNPSISNISLYCSEVLAVVLQENDEIREYFGQLGLVANILKAIDPYRKHKVNESEVVEMVENLFDCLCSLLFVSSNKDRWIQLEGIELCLDCIRYQQQFRHAALRCLDFAITRGPFVGKRFIQLGGLGILFAMFCEKSKKCSMVLTSQDTEHIVSILYFLFQYSDEKYRLMKKFIENDYEKLKRLILLHKKYEDKINMASDSKKDIEQDELFLLRWEAGLYTLELVDTILAQLVEFADKSEPNLIQVVWNLLREHQIEIQTIEDILKEFAENLEPTDDKSSSRRILYLAQDFVQKMTLLEGFSNDLKQQLE